MEDRRNRLTSLARTMISQARLLKRRGLVEEARGMARRAVELNHMGHRQVELQPVRIRNNRH